MPKPQRLKLEAAEIETFHAFERNIRQYWARRNEYKRAFPDAYVAVLDGKVIAHAQDLKTLIDSLRKEGRDLTPLFLDHLSDKAKLILRGF